MLIKRKHSKQRTVPGHENKDVESMVPALKNVTQTLQGHHNLNVTYTNVLKDFLVLPALIPSLVLFL